MLYYLAWALMPYISAMNAFTYHTVRAGGAALTGFVFCLMAGPWIIHMLRSLKIGQYIRKEHVASLHELHKGKAGTPTMGGTMIIFSTLVSLALWGRLNNRMLWISAGVLLLLGTVGFLDDFIKLKRKHNMGLSAKAKFAGQILTGVLLGVYLVYNPITVSATYVSPRDVLDWPSFVRTLANAESAGQPSPVKRIWDRLDDKGKAAFSAAAREELLQTSERRDLLLAINTVMGERGLFDAKLWPVESLNAEARGWARRDQSSLSEMEMERFNRLLLETAMPGSIAQSVLNLHTKVGVPGFKDFYIPMGPFYILFVILIIVSISNAVNLTDGLDGLAAGTSIVSILTYAGIAYVVSRADWSQYLYLTYVPEASELFVFGGALLGTGLGFLWFNSHPAEVFMGDTGSLALGGSLGTMAILTKQELLLPIVAGLFVIEAGSVVIQVASYKLTGKRVFRMAPLHHHFELLGWSETKVTIRFWIIALLLALMSLSTLKLR
jgi:UDP-N-acetylmuramyl pentapeptide phosphotransferase/UDP-N-acetylglucosamine-1-phosphate transferase